MAFKSSVLFLLLCLAVSSLSQGLARRSPSNSPRPSKDILGCWSASFDAAKCSGELLRVARGGMLDLSIWPDCCKAAESMSSRCWPKVFPLNPLFPQILQIYCSRFSLTPPPPPLAPDSEGPSMESVSPPVNDNVDAPAPNADGPVVDALV